MIETVTQVRHGMMNKNVIVKPIVSGRFSFLNIVVIISCYSSILSVAYNISFVKDERL
jgi:hypothetical protein